MRGTTIKWTVFLFLLLSGLISTGPEASAALNLPPGFFTNAGSDGTFAPTSNVTVDLSKAITGDWDSAGGGNGVYDPQKWAVVFKFRSVNIPSGVTVTFSNHPSRAPVVWLINGNAVINGAVNLDGQKYSSTHGIASEPGPGGFRGGYQYESASQIGSGGFGPGGTIYRETDGTRRDGSYATVGASGGPIYGNHRILPLIGGSGGGGGAYKNIYTGGGGGGAILMVVNGSLTLNGVIYAKGGSGYYQGSPYGWQSGNGSGGAVRLVADSFGGNVNGGVTVDALDGSAAGGRIRLEANSVTGEVRFYPQTDEVAPDNPVLIWPPEVAPSVEVVSVDEIPAPNDPRSKMEAGQSDLTINYTGSSRIKLQTQNVDIVNGSVQVRVAPKSGNAKIVNAVFNSGTRENAVWVAETNLPTGFFVVQAIAKNPEQ